MKLCQFSAGFSVKLIAEFHLCSVALAARGVKGLAKRGNMFPETFVSRACFPNVSQFCRMGSIVSGVNFVSKKQNWLLLHSGNISCLTARHGNMAKRGNSYGNLFPRVTRSLKLI